MNVEAATCVAACVGVHPSTLCLCEAEFWSLLLLQSVHRSMSLQTVKGASDIGAEEERHEESREDAGETAKEEGQRSERH